MDEDEGVNGELVELGSSETIPLVHFLEASSRIPARFRLRAELRYFSVVDVSAHRGWGGLAGERAERVVGGRELDADLLFFARSGDRMPSFSTFAFLHSRNRTDELVAWPAPVVADYVLAHNFAALLVPPVPANGSVGARDAELLGIGGQYFPSDLGPALTRRAGPRRRDGVNLLRARSLAEVLSGKWLPWSTSERVLRPAVLLGNHPGCLDMMDRSVHFGKPGTCGFDGKFSLARLRGRFLLYARANTRAAGGGRFVQVMRSESDDPAGAYGPFQLLNVSGYAHAKGNGNIYFAAVQAHPFAPDMVLGLFPLNRGTVRGRYNSDGPSSIALALSCDGVHFSSLQTLARTTGVDGRTFDHPVDGLVRRGRSVHFYVHKDVPGISPAAYNRTRLVRHTLRSDALARLTSSVRARLQGCEQRVERSAAASGASQPQPQSQPASAASLTSSPSLALGGAANASRSNDSQPAASATNDRLAQDQQPSRWRTASGLRPEHETRAPEASALGGTQISLFAEQLVIAAVSLVVVALVVIARARRGAFRRSVGSVLGKEIPTRPAGKSAR